MASEHQPDTGSQQQPTPERRIDRRRMLAASGFFGLGASALVGSGSLGYWLARRNESAGATAAGPNVPETLRYYSLPDLTPPEVKVAPGRTTTKQHRPPREEFIFLAPRNAPKAKPPHPQTGPMIIDRTGELVWFKPSEAAVHDFRAQHYRGEPVLTWWEGNVIVGHGEGKGVITGTDYSPIATVEAAGDLKADLHEFQLTDRGTAYLTIYRLSRADLSGLGAQSDRALHSGIVQEIDIDTGELLFQWDSLDHVPLTETGIRPDPDIDTPFDYFHLNSIVELDQDTLLISARNTHAVYSISKSTGKINWRLGGKNSDFRLPPEARFHFQHDATAPEPGEVMIFDNAATPQRGPESRAIVFRLDEDAKTAEVAATYAHPAGLLANYLGNAQRLRNGNVLVGWGAEPYFTEFTAAGEIALAGRLPEHVQSYRITAHPWSGRPTEPPAIAIGATKARGFTVYASWNGATDVAAWLVLAGARADALAPVSTARRIGFETAVPVSSTGRFFQAAALDADGNELARSRIREAKF